jgi:ABC-type Mn2+/Zn2+ transport system ATPase subunit
MDVRVTSVRVGTRTLPWLAGFQFSVTDIPVVLFGANGVGKSTLLRALARENDESCEVKGCLPAVSDTVYIDSSASNYFAFRTAAVSLFSQSTRRRRSFSRDLRMALDLLSVLPLSERLFNANVLSLSSGERKVLALASALTLQPKLLLIDEPFAHVDPRLHSAIASWISFAAAAGTQVVFSAHEALSNSIPVQSVFVPGPSHSLCDEISLEGLSSYGLSYVIDKTDTQWIGAHNGLVVGSHASYFGGRAWTKAIPHEIRIVPGRPLLLVGANGSGKSSCLRTLGGLRAAVEGTVCFGGASVYGFGTKATRTALQSQTAYGVLSAIARDEFLAQQTAQVLTSQGAKAMLDRAFGWTTWNNSAWQLSSGQQSILCLISALVSNRRNLNLDEPFANLDAATRQAAGELLGNWVRNNGLTCIVAAHDSGSPKESSYFDETVCIQ